MFDLELKKQLEALVIKNEIDQVLSLYLGSLSEVKAEFEELSEIIKKIRLDIIVISANWVELKSKISKGIINSETESLERQRMLYRLLELIDEIPKSKKLYNYLKIKEGVDLDFTVSLNSKFNRINFTLQILIKGELVNKDLIKQLSLKSDSDIEEILLAKCKKAIAKFSGQFTPKELLFSFYETEEENGNQSIIEQLTNALKYELEKYDIRIYQLLILPTFSNIKERFKQLNSKIHSVNIEVLALNGKEVQRINYVIDFQILGVTPEYLDQFLTKIYKDSSDEISTIKSMIESTIKSKIGMIPSEILAYQNLETQGKLESIITKHISDKIKKTFGLMIEVLNVRREPTTREKTQVELNEKNQIFEKEFPIKHKKAIDKSGLKTNLIMLERSIKELRNYL